LKTGKRHGSGLEASRKPADLDGRWRRRS
jgi:hypothetical protein